MLALKKIFSRNGKLIVARLLLAAAFLLAVYLASISLSGGSAVGCGPDSNCHQVLTSRWSSWLGLPVSLLAATAYLALFVASFRVAAAVERGRAGRAGELIAVLAIVVIGAAFWFVGCNYSSSKVCAHSA